MTMQKVYQALDYLTDRFKGFDIWEIGVFKVCLLAFGVLIGLYAGKTCRKFAPLVWIAFIASYIYVIYKLFIFPSLYPRED